MTIETTDQALSTLGVDDDLLTTEQKAQLDDAGFCLLPVTLEQWRDWGVDFSELREQVDLLSEEEGWRGGLEGKYDFLEGRRPLETGARRLGNLVEKHEVFRRVAIAPPILAASHHVVAGDIKFSSLNFRDPVPGKGEQRLHVDWIARQDAQEPFGGCICFVYLDDMTLDNGPTRVVPGTHKVLNWPDAYVDVDAAHPDEVQLTAQAGWIAAANLHLWHSGTSNRSGARRRVLNVTYRRRGVPQFLNPRKFLSAHTCRAMSDAERYLYAIRDADPVQQADNVGPGASYRKWLAEQARG